MSDKTEREEKMEVALGQISEALYSITDQLKEAMKNATAAQCYLKPPGIGWTQHTGVELVRGLLHDDPQSLKEVVWINPYQIQTLVKIAYAWGQGIDDFVI